MVAVRESGRVEGRTIAPYARLQPFAENSELVGVSNKGDGRREVDLSPAKEGVRECR
jgi:hypothetical protein